MKRILPIIALVVLAAVASTLLVSCSSSDKPSKAELRKAFENEGSLDEEPYAEYKDELLDCIVDKMYPVLSKKALEFITESKDFGSDEFDKKAKTAGVYSNLQDAGDEAEDCFEDVMGAASDDDVEDGYEDEAESSSDEENASLAKTQIRNAITAVKALQTGQGTIDFSQITISELTLQEPNLKFVAVPLRSSDDDDTVAVLKLSVEQIVMQGRTEEGECFFVELNASAATRYGSSQVDKNAICDVAPNANTGVDYTTTQAAGWETE